MFEAPVAVSPFTAAVVERKSGSRSSARHIVAELGAMAASNAPKGARARRVEFVSKAIDAVSGANAF